MVVSTKSVRDLLDNIASEHLKDESIEANIERYGRIVDDVKDPTITDEDKIDDATRAGAVWLSYGTYTEGITQDLGNISVADETKLDHFRKVAEFFLNRISKEKIDLDTEGNSLIGVPPEVASLTTSDAYTQSS